MPRKTALKVVEQSQYNGNEQKVNTVNTRAKVRIDDLKTCPALTANQQSFYDAYKRGNKNIALHGVAGTGKTYIAIYKALEDVLDKGTPTNKILVIRSAVQSRDIGHLPGDVGEKLAVFQQPYQQICNILFNRKDAWAKLEEQGVIEFVSTSFIRGTTFDDCIIIVDEMQNMNFEEIDTIMTRVGYRSRIIWCGDYRQTDLRKNNDKSGILQFFEVAKYMKSFTRVEFQAEDIVRSDLVKEYILAKIEFEDREE